MAGSSGDLLGLSGLDFGGMSSLTAGGALTPSSSAASSNGPFSAGFNGGFVGGAIQFAPSTTGAGNAGLNIPSWAWLVGAVVVYALAKRKL